MVPWAVVLAGAVVALAFYYYIVGRLRHFANTGIPYLKPKIFVGNMGPVIMKQRAMAEQVKFLYDSYPDARYIGFHDFTIPTIMLRDPEIIKYVTVKNFDNFVNHTALVSEDLDPFFGKNLFGLRDEKWREMRSILSPAFTSSKMKAMFQLVSRCGTEFAAHVISRPQPNEIDLKDNFTRYTMDVIASAAFGIEVDSLREPNNEFYLMGRDATTFDFFRTLKIFLLKIIPKVMIALRIRIIDDKVTSFFTHIVSSTVRSREAEGKTRNDMIQLMIQARDSGKAPNLSINDMTAQAFVFFFGGFDTTSTAMSFAAYAIATNKTIQERLIQEIDEVLESGEGQLTWEAFQGMHYLEAVINEALRMYPPASFIDRVCNRAIELPPAVKGGQPYLAKPGSVFWLPFYGMHRDPRYFENPETFDPERFIDPATGKNREPNGFLPFGSGPRFCIGQRFAMMEVKLAIFHLLAKCRLERCSRTRVPIVLSRKSFNLTSEHDFWVRVVPRKQTTDGADR